MSLRADPMLLCATFAPLPGPEWQPKLPGAGLGYQSCGAKYVSGRPATSQAAWPQRSPRRWPPPPTRPREYTWAATPPRNFELN